MIGRPRREVPIRPPVVEMKTLSDKGGGRWWTAPNVWCCRSQKQPRCWGSRGRSPTSWSPDAAGAPPRWAHRDPPPAAAASPRRRSGGERRGRRRRCDHMAHDTPIFDEGIVTVGLSRQSVGSQADAAAGRGIGTVARGPRARFTSRSASTSRQHPSPHPSTLLPRTPPPPHPISRTPLPHEPVLPETTPQRPSDICQPSGQAVPPASFRWSGTC
jgi:hypothetical protein